MSHYAKIEGNIVTQVIVVGDDNDPNETAGSAFCSNLLGGTWVKTSYNTRGGIHYSPNTNAPDGGVALRGNYAGIGYVYDSENDVFYPPRPFPSWNISAPTWTWQPPIPYPTDGQDYKWDEATTSWVLVTPTTTTSTTGN